jgi:hypothetical protein
MKVVVHIERLVLEGLPVSYAQGAQVRVALARELSAMLAGGLAPELRAGCALPQVSVPQMAFAATDPPAAIGRAIARSVHGRIGDAGANASARRTLSPQWQGS